MKKALFFILLTTTIGYTQTPAAISVTPPARNTWDVLSQF
jgi:hypothetical protein